VCQILVTARIDHNDDDDFVENLQPKSLIETFCNPTTANFIANATDLF